VILVIFKDLCFTR